MQVPEAHREILVARGVEDGIPVGLLGAEENPVGSSGAGRLVPDLPVAHVRREDPEIHAAVPRALDVIAHRATPVLVVADEKDGLSPLRECRVSVDVDVGGVGHVVALLLDPAQKGVLPSGGTGRVAHAQKLSGARAAAGFRLRRVGTIERDAERAPSEAVEVVEALPAPVVVRLPSIHGALDEDRGAPGGRSGPAAGFAHDEGDECLLSVGGAGEAREIDAADPIGTDRNAAGHRPAALDQPVVTPRFGDRPQAPLHRSKLEDAAGPLAPVPAHPEHVDREPGGSGADMEPEGLTRLDAGRLGVTLDLVLHGGVPKLPRSGSGALVLQRNGALRGVGQGPPGRHREPDREPEAHRGDSP